MRSKVRTRVTPPTQPAPTSRASGVIFGVMLLVIGVAVGLSAGEIVKLVPASATSAPSASASASNVALASPSESSPASESPSASPTPPAPVLEREMPRSVNGTTLTVQSATDATSLGRGPMFRALNAGVTKLGKKPSDLEIAEAYDAAG